MADIYTAEKKPAGEKEGIKEEKDSSSPVKTKKKDPRSAKLKEARKRVYRLLGQQGNGMSAFVARPRRFHFETQMVKEENILVLRRHWITNLGWLTVVILMSLAPVLFRHLPPFDSLPSRFALVIVLLWYLFVFAVFLERFLCWYFAVNIITDERIIDIDLISLIQKRVSDAEIENIEDVTYQMGGLLGTMINYGTISIQTAAEKREFEFENVPKPALVVKVLQNLRLEEKQEAIEGRVS